MAEKTLYIVRHAEPDFGGGPARCLGRRLDLPLSENGRRQAHALKAFFAQLPVEAVYTSPLLRAQQTAQPIAGSALPLVTLQQLTELDGGEWDGLTFEEIRSRYPRGSMPPGAESDESGLSRMNSALDIIEAAGHRCAVVVAHGAINQTLLCFLAGRPLIEKKAFAQGHAGISKIEKNNGVWHIAD